MFFTFPLVTLLVMIRGIGLLGPVGIMTTAPASHIRADRGVISIILLISFPIFLELISFLGVVLKF